jgi:hypothetical protein
MCLRDECVGGVCVSARRMRGGVSVFLRDETALVILLLPFAYTNRSLSICACAEFLLLAIFFAAIEK